MSLDRTIIGAAIIAVGVSLAGWFVGHGFLRGRAADRFVTVKGVAEREVEADLALWPIRVVVTDNDLGRAQNRLARDVTQVLAFLDRHGIDTSNVELQEYSVTDVLAERFPQREAGLRYIINQTVMVRSTEPDVVVAASRQVGELVRAGVVLSSGLQQWGPSSPTFLFTRLNDLKPAMIAEATASAREAAEQFARDSRASLAGIRRASQGVFVILPRDQAQGIREEYQAYKIVRVVSTVEYFLKN